MCCFPPASNNSSKEGKSKRGEEGQERKDMPEIEDIFRRIERFFFVSSEPVEVGERGGSSVEVGDRGGSSSFWEVETDDLTPLSEKAGKKKKKNTKEQEAQRPTTRLVKCS